MAETELAGQQLASIRQEKGLSQEEVAAELRLSVTYVKAIEADDYERLPEATFVRGYVRNYARFLGLPDAEAKAIVALYDQHNKHNDAEFKGTRTLPAYSAKRRSWWPLIFLLVLILIVIQGVMMWKKPYSADSEGQAPKAETMRSKSFEPEQQVQEVAANKNSAVINLAAEEDALAAEENKDHPANVEDTAQAEQPIEDAVAPLTTPVESEAVEEEVAAVVEAPNEALQVGFSAECWVSVKNSDGKMLYTGTKQAGDTLTLAESGPYHFVFGNGAAVKTMVINGQQQELPARRSGQVWRPTFAADE